MSSSQHTGIILGMQAGEVMPLEAYQKAATGMNIAGFALVLDGELKVVRNGEPFTDEEFMTWQEQVKGENRILFLGKFPENYSEEDAQPLVMTTEDGKPTSVIFIEGDYSNLHQPEETCADENQLLKRVINPMLNKYIKDNEDATPEGFVNQLVGVKHMHDMVQDACVARGVAVFMTGDGTVKSISKNDLKFDASWGSMSQNCGYSEGTFPEKEEPSSGIEMKVKKKKMMTSTADPAAPAKETSPPPGNKEGPVDRPAAAPDAPNKPGSPVVPDLQTAIFNPPQGKVYVRPNKGLTKSDQKSVYHQVGGFTPSKQSGDYSWHERPWILAELEKAMKYRNKIEFKDQTALANALAASRSDKDTTPHALKADQTRPVETVKPTDVAIIPMSMMGDYNAKFVKSPEVEKTLKGPSLTIAQVEAWEKEHPDFVKKTGMTLGQLANLPYHKKVELCSQYHFLAALALQTYGNQYIKSDFGKPAATSVPETGKTDTVVKKTKKMSMA